MRSVGLRELKNRLGTYMRYVRRGEAVAITDRGEIVAELAPASRVRDAASALEAMARRGEATLAKPLSKEKRKAVYQASAHSMLKGTSVQALLDAERGEL